MIARGSGHVVVVASLAGLVGAPGMVAYSTTKFALVGFAESLRLELDGTGVGVSTVCPGYVYAPTCRAPHVTAMRVPALPRRRALLVRDVEGATSPTEIVDAVITAPLRSWCWARGRWAGG